MVDVDDSLLSYFSSHDGLLIGNFAGSLIVHFDGSLIDGSLIVNFDELMAFIDCSSAFIAHKLGLCVLEVVLVARFHL